jgi:hypothetical protein
MNLSFSLPFKVELHASMQYPYIRYIDVYAAAILWIETFEQKQLSKTTHGVYVYNNRYIEESPMMWSHQLR